ncbi:MAG: gluconeogenesis factor YvcK family protein [Candidatus Sericytochromatia bacterium]|nr:gluconeogenesis factor YvcK family protein [Candidatus Sericytochromatia bacterium]
MATWREIRTWALPGMRVKRWLSLLIAGVIAINLAVACAVYDWLRPGPGLTHWALLLLLVGVGALILALQRLIALTVDVLKPGAQLVDAVYANRTRKRGPRLVAIGGGTGLATLLRGLKGYSDNITAIVTVADDGGSSGRLRQELGVLPPGDIRNCLSALAGEERLLTDLFNFRFPGERGLGGHAFGNLFLAAVIGVSGDPLRAIEAACQILAVRGTVVPATAESMTLYARFEDGTVVEGESNITAWRKKLTDMWSVPAAPRAVPAAIRAIEEADAIVIGPGSLYTSLVPNLLVPEIRAAIQASRAPKIYICNVMTQPGETDGFTAADHLRVLSRYGGEGLVQHVLVNDDLPRRLRERYEAQGQYPVVLDWEALKALGVTPVRGALLDEADAVRHHPDLLASAVMTWWESLRPAERKQDQRLPGAVSPAPRGA